VISAALADGLIKVLLALVLITGAFIVTRRNLLSLVTIYSAQSLMLALIALLLYAENGRIMLIYLAALTLISKVIVIPRAIRSVRERMNIRRDMEFAYLTPASSMFVTILMIILVYYAFSRFLHELQLTSLFYLGAVFGISMALMGMLVTFTRRRVITKTIGYLTMENGVLLFGIFLTELPFIIEVLIIVDLIILVVLATLLSVGIDSTIEDFQARLHPFQGRKEDD
jgi:hydrogenase-4 component E